MAKTANLLVHGLDLEPGQRAALLLPAHWQTAALAMGCWSAGLSVDASGDSGRADVVFAGADRLDAARSGNAAEVVAVGLSRLGGPLPGVSPDVTDYGAEVPAYGDSFTPPLPVSPHSLAWPGLSTADLAGAARAAGRRWQLAGGDRVLSVLGYDDLTGWLAGLLAPLAAGAGVVLCRNVDPDRLQARLLAERVTATAGVGVPGVRQLDPG